MTGTDHRAKGTQSAQLWALTDNHTLTVKVTHNGGSRAMSDQDRQHGVTNAD